MKKILVLTTLLLLCISGAAGLETIRVSNLQPDNPELDEDLHIEVILFDNKTQDFDVTLYIQHPSGALTEEGTDTGKISGDTTRFLVFDVNQMNINQYGNYTLIVNDTVSGVEDTYLFKIERDPIDTMTAAIATVLSLLMAGFLLAYIGLNLKPRNKIIAVLRVFLLMMAPFFIPVATFTGGHFAREAGYTAVGEYMNYVFLGTFFVWFFFVFVVGFLFYTDEAVRSYLTKNYDPDIQ